MEKIKKYIDNFFKETKKNTRYSLSFNECMAFMNEFFAEDTNNVFNLVCRLFNFGYAKGYRAAMAEIKKGGAA